MNNPVEKVRAILDELTKPLLKDSPFNSAGRKMPFNNDQNLGNLSFQAFVGRIITFEQKYWGSYPTAAISLAKYGFKNVSRYKVQCVSCLMEIDCEVSLTVGRAEIVHMLAICSHKKSCRWPSNSTSNEYFEFPRNPHRILKDMKVTFTELAGLKSDLPLVRERCWLQMGITKDFVQTMLDFFDTSIIDIFSTSCVVFILSGWVKRSETTLQCNFCRRVIGGNNLFTENGGNQIPAKHSQVISQAKHSRVVSLLYKVITRGMDIKKTGDETSGDRIHENETCEKVPESVAVPENRKNGTYFPPTGYSEFENHSQYSRIIPNDDKIQNGLKISKDEKTQMRETRSIMHAKEIKKQALRFLWKGSRRWREKYPFKVFKLEIERELREFPRSTVPFEEPLRPVVQCEEQPPVQHSDSLRTKEPPEAHQVPPRLRTIIGGIVTDTIFIDKSEWLVPCKVANNDNRDIVPTSANNVCNDEFRFNPNGSSEDNNGHCREDHSNWEGLNPNCESFSHDKEITVKSRAKNSLIMPPEKFMSGYSSSPRETVNRFTNREFRSEVAGEPFQMCHSHTSCNCEVCATQTDLKRKLDDCNTRNSSGNSCNNCDVSNSEVSGNSAGRKKRKLVPEGDQNGTANSSVIQVLQEPVHFTGSKNKSQTSVVGDVEADDSINITSECAVVFSQISSRVSKRDICDSVKSTSENAPDISSARSSVVDEDEPEKMISENKVMTSSPLSNVGIEDEVNLHKDLRTCSCKWKRKKYEEDSSFSCGLPNLEKHLSEMGRFYVHPIFEHHFWCVWRIPFSDDVKSRIKIKMGWEYYADCIQKALELHKTEKHSVLEMEKSALNNLSEIEHL